MHGDNSLFQRWRQARRSLVCVNCSFRRSFKLQCHFKTTFQAPGDFFLSEKADENQSSVLISNINRQFFRSVMPIIRDIFEEAGSLEAFVEYIRDVLYVRRVLSKNFNSDTLHFYEEVCVQRSRFVGIDIYADETTLANSDTQSACVVRLRVFSVRGGS